MPDQRLEGRIAMLEDAVANRTAVVEVHMGIDDRSRGRRDTVRYGRCLRPIRFVIACRSSYLGALITAHDPISAKWELSRADKRATGRAPSGYSP